MLLTNGTVLHEDYTFHQSDIRIDSQHKIKEVGEQLSPEPGEEVRDVAGLYVTPGLIDIHIHGSFGYDVSSPVKGGLEQMTAYLWENGITSFCPTTMTLSKERTEHVLTSVAESPSASHARILGFHLEGPFISRIRCGAQDPSAIIPPDLNWLHHLMSIAKVPIRMITVAPEIRGGIRFIEAASKELTVSIGHSDADYDIAAKAFHAGASHVTHMYNAMAPFHHRTPGIPGAVADTSEGTVELICDGYHVHPSVVRNTFRLFGSSRVILVSDATMSTGLTNGTYSLGGTPVIKRDAKVSLFDGTLAGSGSSLMDCVKKAISFGISIEDAFGAATMTPAKKTGVFSQLGGISPGKEADLLLLDSQLNLLQVL